MCGRFGSTKPPWGLARRHGAKLNDLAFTPRYNIAPSQPVIAMSNDAERTVVALRWGLVPAWASDATAKKTTAFNARVESLAVAPAYRSVVRTRRCAIFADGYYEWRRNPDGTKTPMWLFLKSGDPFVFAGIWDVWRSRATGNVISSCSIVTQPPNEFVIPIHSRMPVVLADEAIDAWLDPEPRDTAALLKVLGPTPAALWDAYAVSSRVGNVRNDDPGLLESLLSA